MQTTLVAMHMMAQVREDRQDLHRLAMGESFVRANEAVDSQPAENGSAAVPTATEPWTSLALGQPELGVPCRLCRHPRLMLRVLLRMLRCLGCTSFDE